MTKMTMPGGYSGHRAPEGSHVESSMVATGPGFITQSGEPTEAQFEYIRQHFGDPRANVKPSDYYAFRMIASGDGLDSYFTRQDTATSFPNFVRDLKKGQSVLGHHQVESFSYGSSFDGEVAPADEDRAEYEPSFYPQWDTPELRTKSWLVGDYYITRGVTLNNQSSNDLVRSMELGGVRKASISFMVGQYVCGLDGHDLMGTMFGPMPDAECQHFPGVAYDGQIAWALMKNNTLVETSLVYKNASPSSMLLRKAGVLAQQGSLSARDIEKLEGRFQVRLPAYVPRVFTIPLAPETTNSSSDTTFTNISGMEDPDMANRRGSGDVTTRALAREALTTEPEQLEITDDGAVDEAAPDATAEREVGSDPTPDPEPTTEETTETPEAVETDETTVETDETTDGEAERSVADEARHKGHSHQEGGGHKKSTSDTGSGESEDESTIDATDIAPEAEAVSESTAEEDDPAESETGTTREETAVAAFVHAADQLSSALARNPDAFDSGQLSVAARAERAIDLALIDAGCDTTVGGHVARTFETRSKSLRETLGEPLTVEAIRSLQSRATLGETLYEELVKDAVAARVGAQSDSFNSIKYRDLLLAARDVTYVKEEIESYKEQKSVRFTPGRSVVPRQVSDVRTSKDERKSLPEAPKALTASKPKETDPSMSIFAPRKK